MSAFIVTNDHISAIMSAYKRCRYADGFDRADIGQMLIDANYKSVNYRYQEKDTPHQFVSNPYWQSHPVTEIQAIKAIDCLIYHSCEYPGWQRSRAKKWLDLAKETLLKNTKGWDNAVWNIGRPEDVPTEYYVQVLPEGYLALR